MPVCTVCGKDFPREMMELKRNDAGKWIALCRACRDMPDQKANPKAAAEATAAKADASKSDSAIAKIDGLISQDTLDRIVGVKPASSSTIKAVQAAEVAAAAEGAGPKTVRDRMKKKELDDFERMKDALRALANRHSHDIDATEDELFQHRAHERLMTHLQLEFAYARDEKTYIGMVRDISQGGIRFVSAYPLAVGDTLRAVVHSAGEAVGPDKVETYLEVRRILSSENGVTEVGARFVSRTAIDEKNRRRYPRHDFKGPVFYSRRGCILIAKGVVLDISQGGVRMMARDALDVGEEISMRIRTQPPAFAHADLVGFMQVLRAQRVGARQYEVGCRFQKVRVMPIDKNEGQEHNEVIDPV